MPKITLTTMKLTSLLDKFYNTRESQLMSLVLMFDCVCLCKRASLFIYEALTINLVFIAKCRIFIASIPMCLIRELFS